MLFDFNYDYKSTYTHRHPIGKPVADFPTRVQSTIKHVINVPVKVVEAIIEIAKLAFLALVCALFLGQGDILNKFFVDTAKNIGMIIPMIGSSTLGFFAPMNARDWNVELIQMRAKWGYSN